MKKINILTGVTICIFSSVLLASYKVEVANLHSQVTLAKVISSTPDQGGQIVDKTLGEVEAFAKKNKIKISRAPYVRTFQWSQQAWKFEAGYPVEGKIKISEGGEVKISELPGGKAAKVLHVGPTEKTEAAYKEVEEWIIKNKKIKSGPPWELYLNSAATTKPENLKTEIFMPIKN